MSKTFYFCLYSNTSRNGMSGLRPQVMFNERSELISAASAELARQGECFEDMAGIEWVEDENENLKPAREISDNEQWALTIDKFGDDGRLFQAFEDTEAGRQQFIEAADAYGLRDEAAALVERFA